MSATPLTQQGLCRFVVRLAEEGVAHATMKVYLAGVKDWLVTRQMGDQMANLRPLLDKVLKGIRRQQAKSKASQPKKPISPELLGRLVRAWESHSEACLLRAAATVLSFGAFRAGDLMQTAGNKWQAGRPMSRGDVTVQWQGPRARLRMHLRESKTDQLSKGETIYIGETGCSPCAVTAMRAYLLQRGQAEGSLFRRKSGQTLSQDWFTHQLRAALASLGLQANLYSSHSFRAGAATTAVQRGLPEATVKHLGRWRSSVYKTYVRPPKQDLSAVAATLAGNSPGRSQAREPWGECAQAGSSRPGSMPSRAQQAHKQAQQSRSSSKGQQAKQGKAELQQTWQGKQRAAEARTVTEHKSLLVAHGGLLCQL